MFERMELAKFIYEGVVESSYKKITSTYANRASHRRKRITPRRVRFLASA